MALLCERGCVHHGFGLAVISDACVQVHMETFHMRASSQKPMISTHGGCGVPGAVEPLSFQTSALLCSFQKNNFHSCLHTTQGSPLNGRSGWSARTSERASVKARTRSSTRNFSLGSGSYTKRSLLGLLLLSALSATRPLDHLGRACSIMYYQGSPTQAHIEIAISSCFCPRGTAPLFKKVCKVVVRQRPS